MLTQFFDSFKDIEEGDFNMANWIGKVGACVVKHEEYNGNINAKISYFLNKDKQSDLPAWVEPEGLHEGMDDNSDCPFPTPNGDLPLPF